jgi:hypothetical protein
MARHARADDLDQRTNGRLPDGDVVPVAGYRRWQDLPPANVADEPTRELPLVPSRRLVRPYVLRWLRR